MSDLPWTPAETEAEMQRAHEPERMASTIPENAAIIQRIGWEEDDGERVFTATLVFPNGPPPLPLSVVWDATPVRITIVFPDGSVRDE